MAANVLSTSTAPVSVVKFTLRRLLNAGELVLSSLRRKLSETVGALAPDTGPVGPVGPVGQVARTPQRWQLEFPQE